MMKGLVVDPGSLRQGPVGMIREKIIFSMRHLTGKKSSQ
jgi:hypothetical protein